MHAMPFIQLLQKLSLFRLWLFTIIASVMMTGVIVLGMELLLKGAVTYDYLLTGFVASLAVSGIIVACLTMLLAQLRRDAELQQGLIDKLGKCEAQARDAMRAAQSAFWEYDLTTGRVHLSEYWVQLMGGAEGQTDLTIGELTERVPVEEREMVRAAIVGALKGEGLSAYKVEHRFRKNDGSYLWMSSEGRVVERGADGRALRMAGINRDISERREAELEFRTIVQATGDGFWMVRLNDGCILDVNPAYCAMTGYSREELLAMRVFDIAEKQGREQVEGNIEQLKSGKSLRFETRHRRKDGTLLDVEINARYLEAHGGVVVTFIRDISERKQAETEFRGVVQACADGFWMFTVPDGRIVEVNPAYCAMTGYSREELLDMSVFDIVEKFTREQIEANIDSIRSGQPFRGESRHRRKDGTSIDVEVSSRYMEARGGVIITFVRDITERKEVEREVRIASAAFESQEGMLITDADSVIQRVNNAFTEITGYTADEAVGKNPRLLSSGRHDRNFYDALWQTLIQTGAWSGEIWNRRKSGEIYPERLTITAVKDADGKVVNYVGSLADITLRKKSEEEIQRLAYYDHLTDLPNRRLLMERLHQAQVASARRELGGALLFIDLDNFKNLNDTLGHDIGDMLLKQVATRLTACVREGDSVARLGGDEFVVLLTELSKFPYRASEQARIIGEKLIASLSESYRLAAHEHICTASVGITLFQGREQEPEALLRQADIAMYQAKHAGRNTLRFFDQKMQESINERAALEVELRKAIERDQFRVYYQAQVNAKGRPEGVEALLRWQHPELGLVPPAQFIPLAEETGLIAPVGMWVLEAACAQIARWQGREPFSKLSVAVNISADQFYRADFVDYVLSLIGKHNINPMLLKLELTESLAMEDIEAAIQKMNVLKEAGISFSLDDFGTGYSSLSYLKRLPLDQIKIDQSFVRNITEDNADKVMVMAITGLGMNFELNIIAEGVETEAQFRLLHRCGCETFQGYLFSKPLPIEQLEEWVLQQKD